MGHTFTVRHVQRVIKIIVDCCFRPPDNYYCSTDITTRDERVCQNIKAKKYIPKNKHFIEVLKRRKANNYYFKNIIVI